MVNYYYMEHFEQQAMSTTTLSPASWYRYVDDTFAILPYSEELQNFLRFLNCIHINIKFPKERRK